MAARGTMASAVGVGLPVWRVGPRAPRWGSVPRPWVDAVVSMGGRYPRARRARGRCALCQAMQDASPAPNGRGEVGGRRAASGTSVANAAGTPTAALGRHHRRGPASRRGRSTEPAGHPRLGQPPAPPPRPPTVLPCGAGPRGQDPRAPVGRALSCRPRMQRAVAEEGAPPSARACAVVSHLKRRPRRRVGRGCVIPFPSPAGGSAAWRAVGACRWCGAGAAHRNGQGALPPPSPHWCTGVSPLWGLSKAGPRSGDTHGRKSRRRATLVGRQLQHKRRDV